jgi:hypothetical protein
VKPQTGLLLDKARQQLQRADAMLGIRLHDDVGRAAYLAGLHAAQALIFEIADKARNAIGAARRFVDCVTALIPPNGHTPPAAESYT